MSKSEKQVTLQKSPTIKWGAIVIVVTTIFDWIVLPIFQSRYLKKIDEATGVVVSDAVPYAARVIHEISLTPFWAWIAIGAIIGLWISRFFDESRSKPKVEFMSNHLDFETNFGDRQVDPVAIAMKNPAIITASISVWNTGEPIRIKEWSVFLIKGRQEIPLRRRARPTDGDFKQNTFHTPVGINPVDGKISFLCDLSDDEYPEFTRTGLPHMTIKILAVDFNNGKSEFTLNTVEL